MFWNKLHNSVAFISPTAIFHVEISTLYPLAYPGHMKFHCLPSLFALLNFLRRKLSQRTIIRPWFLAHSFTQFRSWQTHLNTVINCATLIVYPHTLLIIFYLEFNTNELLHHIVIRNLNESHTPTMWGRYNGVEFIPVNVCINSLPLSNIRPSLQSLSRPNRSARIRQNL